MKRRKQIETLVVLTLALLVAARWKRSWNYAYAGLALLLLGLAWKGFADVLHKGWMKLGEGMGYVTGKILLSGVFFLLLAPISFFARRSGKLAFRLKSDGKTGFRRRDHAYTKEDLENPW